MDFLQNLHGNRTGVPQDFLGNLPEDLIEIIFNNISSYEDTISFSHASKRYYSIFNSIYEVWLKKKIIHGNYRHKLLFRKSYSPVPGAVPGVGFPSLPFLSNRRLEKISVMNVFEGCHIHNCNKCNSQENRIECYNPVTPSEVHREIIQVALIIFYKINRLVTERNIQRKLDQENPYLSSGIYKEVKWQIKMKYSKSLKIISYFVKRLSILCKQYPYDYFYEELILLVYISLVTDKTEIIRELMKRSNNCKNIQIIVNNINLYNFHKGFDDIRPVNKRIPLWNISYLPEIYGEKFRAFKNDVFTRNNYCLYFKSVKSRIFFSFYDSLKRNFKLSAKIVDLMMEISSLNLTLPYNFEYYKLQDLFFSTRFLHMELIDYIIRRKDFKLLILASKHENISVSPINTISLCEEVINERDKIFSFGKKSTRRYRNLLKMLYFYLIICLKSEEWSRGLITDSNLDYLINNFDLKFKEIIKDYIDNYKVMTYRVINNKRSPLIICNSNEYLGGIVSDWYKILKQEISS